VPIPTFDTLTRLNIFVKEPTMAFEETSVIDLETDMDPWTYRAVLGEDPVPIPI
jgi:hypothetical protein